MLSELILQVNARVQMTNRNKIITGVGNTNAGLKLYKELLH